MSLTSSCLRRCIASCSRSSPLLRRSSRVRCRRSGSGRSEDVLRCRRRGLGRGASRRGLAVAISSSSGGRRQRQLSDQIARITSKIRS